VKGVWTEVFLGEGTVNHIDPAGHRSVEHRPVVVDRQAVSGAEKPVFTNTRSASLAGSGIIPRG
jgi:hypothetical protein